MNKAKRQIRRERIARAVGLGRSSDHGWRRRLPHPNRGLATTEALRAAEAKRERRRVRNLELRVCEAHGYPSNARRRLCIVPPGAPTFRAYWYRPAWKRAR